MKPKRGFAAMDPNKLREIAQRGGAAVPKGKRAFATNPELARTAGSKGGHSVAPSKRMFHVDRDLAAAAGRKGGMRHAAKSSPKV